MHQIHVECILYLCQTMCTDEWTNKSLFHKQLSELSEYITITLIGSQSNVMYRNGIHNLMIMLNLTLFRFTSQVMLSKNVSKNEFIHCLAEKTVWQNKPEDILYRGILI